MKGLDFMNEIFSKNIRNLRLAKNLTQEQVAERLQVSAQSVSRWECGATFPDILLLPEVSRLFGVLVDDLFRENPDGYGNLAGRLLAVYESSRKREDFVNAALEFDRLIKSGTAGAEDYRKYGVLHQYMVGDCRKRACECYDKAMELSRENDTELFYRTKEQKVMLLSQTRQGEGCIAEQKQAVKEAPQSFGEWKCLVAGYYWSGLMEDAYQAVKEAITRFPEEAGLFMYAGDICRKLGKQKEAFPYWEKAAALDTRYLDSKYSMAFCYEELGEYEKACSVWEDIAAVLTERGLDVDAKWPAEMAERCRKQKKQ